MNTRISKIIIPLLLALGFTTAASAATQVAVFEDFTPSTISGGGYTVNLNGNAATVEGVTIGSNAATKGITLAGSTTWNGSDGITVVIRYSSLTAGSSTKEIATFKLSNKNDCVGVGMDNEGKSIGLYQGASGAVDWKSGKAGELIAIPAADTVFVGFKDSEYTKMFGTDGSGIRGGTQLYYGNGLREGGKLVGDLITIGSTSVPTQLANGMVISGIAIYSGFMDVTERKNFFWPSEVVEVTASTTVAAINAATPAATKLLLNVADGVTIDYGNDTFEASNIRIVSSGTVTLSASAQPSAAELAKLDVSGVEGKVVRSWMTASLGIVGMNFNANGARNGTRTGANADDTSGALAAGGTWYSDPYNTSGSVAVSADGLTKVSWSCNNVYTTSANITGGTFMQGYLDDGGNQANVSVTGIPYDIYDVIIYCATDNSDKSFKAKTVNGTNYKWDTATKRVISDGVAATDTWGSAQVAVGAAVYGSNAIRINGLTGKLTITGGTNGNNARGCIAAIQIMPTGEGKAYQLELAENANVVWSQAAWTGGDTYPITESATITLAGDATITVDKALDIPSLTILGTGTLTFVTGEDSLAVGNVKTGGPALSFDEIILKGDIQPRVSLTANATITVPAEHEASITGVISGDYKLTKAGAGTLTMKAANTLTGGLEVGAGILKTTASQGYGPYTADAALDALSKIAVLNGATLDLANTSGNCYDIAIAGAGAEGTGALINSGSELTTGNRQTSRLTLTANATVGGNTFGLVGSGYAATELVTGGHQLTVSMNEGKSFIVYNTTVKGGGKIVVNAGALNCAGALTMDLTGVTIAQDTVLVEWAEETSAPRFDGLRFVGQGDYGWCVDGRQLKVVTNVAQIGETIYTSLASAIEAAGPADTVRILANLPSPLAINKDVTLACADGAVMGGALTGTGSITIPAGETLAYTGTASIGPTIKGAGTLALANYTGALATLNGLTDVENWTGTFEFRNVTCNNVGNGVAIQSFCNVNSTLRFNGYTQYLIYGTVRAKALEVTDTLNLSGSYGAGPEYRFVVDTFSGTGAITNGIATGSNAAAFKIIAKENTFTGSIACTSNYRLAFLADENETVGGANGCLYVGANAVVSVPSGKTWSSSAGVYIAEGGELKLADATAKIAGSLTGAGALSATGFLPAEEVKTLLTNEVANTGTFWLKNYTWNNWEFGTLGNSNSTVRLTGVKGYGPKNATSRCDATVELVDDGSTAALTQNNGYSVLDDRTTVTTYTFAKMIGTGTFADTIGTATPQVRIEDASTFAGKFQVNKLRLVLGEAGATPINADAGKILVPSGATAKLAKAWQATNGLVVNGTLKPAAALTLASAVTLNDGAAVVFETVLPLTLASLTASADATVSVTVPAGADLTAMTYPLIAISAKPAATFIWTNPTDYPKYRLRARSTGICLAKQGFTILLH